MEVRRSAERVEAVRQSIRSRLGYGSPVYQLGARGFNFVATWRKEGIRTWRRLRSLELGNPRADSEVVRLRSLQHPIRVRPGTADVSTVINNVIREEYGAFQFDHDPVWMIDAGAYIGDTSAYFLSRFPKLRVIALEPNPETYQVVQQNLEPYGERATLLKKGLYGEDTTQHFQADGPGSAIGSSGMVVDCISIPTLLEQYSIPEIDILKIDIEGAEDAVFRSIPEAWLDRVRLLLIEIHNADAEALILRIMAEHGFESSRYRSLWYFTRPSTAGR